MQKLISLNGNSLKLDGGTMFGNAPKAMWSKWCTPDELNLLPMNCRSLLVIESNKNILFDTGVGSFFSPELKKRFAIVENNHILLDSLHTAGLTHTDIDFIVLSHLHFDHCGGLLSDWQENIKPQLLFPKARFLVSKQGWERAINPHARDHASFPKIIIQMLANSDRLEIIDSETSNLLGSNYRFILSNGHTPGLLCTEIKTLDEPLIYVSDLIPGTPWVYLPITTSYDRAAEEVVNEKKLLLEYIVKHNARIFYGHDPKTAVSNVAVNDKGQFYATNLQSNLF